MLLFVDDFKILIGSQGNESHRNHRKIRGDATDDERGGGKDVGDSIFQSASKTNSGDEMGLGEHGREI